MNTMSNETFVFWGAGTEVAAEEGGDDFLRRNDDAKPVLGSTPTRLVVEALLALLLFPLFTCFTLDSPSGIAWTPWRSDDQETFCAAGELR